MNFYLEMAIYFAVVYIISFIIYVFIVNKKNKESLEVHYMLERFKLNKSNKKKIRIIFNIINPLIISTTFIVVINIKSFGLGVLIGFAIMMALIFSVYEIIGRILKRRDSKNEL